MAPALVVHLRPRRDPCNQRAAGNSAASPCGSRGTYIQRLNSAVPHHIGSQAGRGPADDDVIVNGHALGPQHPALVGALVGVVLERDGRRMAIVS
jgi:hypothetical protein